MTGMSCQNVLLRLNPPQNVSAVHVFPIALSCPHFPQILPRNLYIFNLFPDGSQPQSPNHRIEDDRDIEMQMLRDEVQKIRDSNVQKDSPIPAGLGLFMPPRPQHPA